ncbi:MAG: MAPEG family protein [Rhodanobacteraceae bacterium]|nr:MAPEG family protein [Rhodanobacteraceae bacterium]
MNLFPITSIYAALAGLLLLVLAWRVVKVRRRERIGIGDGQNRDLERRVRIHANAVEYVPIALILLALAEAGGTPAWGMHAAGATLILARVLHAVGLTQSPGHSHGRFFGVLLTWLVILSLALSLLLRPLLD